MSSSDESSSSSEASSSGCGTIIVCTLIGCIFGPIGALAGFFIGFMIAESSSESSETLSEDDADEFVEGGFPYEIDATWSGVTSDDSRLKIRPSRLSLESKSSSSSEDIPFSSISTVERSGSTIGLDLIPKDRTTISFPDEETALVVKDVILQVMDGKRPHDER